MKDQSFVVFRTLTLAVRDTALFSCYRFSVCYHEVLNLWWVFAICYKYIPRLLEKYTIINLKGFCKTWIVTKMQVAICFFPKPETDPIPILAFMSTSVMSATHLDDSKNTEYHQQSYCRMGQLPKNVSSEGRMRKTDFFVLLSSYLKATHEPSILMNKGS